MNKYQTRSKRVCGVVSGQDDGIRSCCKSTGATRKVAPTRTCSLRRQNFSPRWRMTWKKAGRGRAALIVGKRGIRHGEWEKARARKTTVKRKGRIPCCWPVGVLWQVGRQENPVSEAEGGPRKRTSSCNSSSSCNSESNPFIWRERSLILDIRRERTERTKRTNPGWQRCRRTRVPDELRISCTSGTGQGWTCSMMHRGHMIEDGTRTVYMRLGPEG